MRQPFKSVPFKSPPTAEGALQVVAHKDPFYSIVATLPEEDLAMDLLELSEHHHLRGFLICSLQAYKAVASHCNRSIARQIRETLDTRLLIQCIKLKGMHFPLRATFIELFSTLYLELEVQNKLMTRGEFILPLAKCSQSVHLFPAAPCKQKETVFSIAMAPLPGMNFAMQNQTYMTHNITSTFSKVPEAEGKVECPVQDLRDMVFHDLEKLLSTR